MPLIAKRGDVAEVSIQHRKLANDRVSDLHQVAGRSARLLAPAPLDPASEGRTALQGGSALNRCQRQTCLRVVRRHIELPATQVVAEPDVLAVKSRELASHTTRASLVLENEHLHFGWRFVRIDLKYPLSERSRLRTACWWMTFNTDQAQRIDNGLR